MSENGGFSEDNEVLELVGFDELLTTLHTKFPLEVSRAAHLIMAIVTLKAVGRTRRNAPVWTGEMRRTIGHEIRTSFGEIQGVVGSPKVYAPSVEQPGNVRRTGRRPFLRPAIEDHINSVINDFVSGFRRLATKLGF